jgi:hypothetical protein
MFDIKLATVSNPKSTTKNASFDAKIFGTSIIVPVIMTTPMGSHPNGSKYYSFAGIFGNPTKDTQILIKKIDDSSYWYFDSVPNEARLQYMDGGGGSKPTLTKPQLGSLESAADAAGAFSHSRVPQKYGMTSPMGHKLILSDSERDGPKVKGDTTGEDMFVKLASRINQRVILNSTTGVALLKNEKQDGIVITSEGPKYKGLSGARSIKTRCFGNLSNISTNGKLTLKVGAAGRMLTMVNTAIKNYNQSPTIPLIDNDVGSVNIESYYNDITLRVGGISPGPVFPLGDGRRIFIDASKYNGLVSIKGGTGGVEIYSAGNIDMACGGDFNVFAAGNINMKGTKVELNPTVFPPKMLKSDFTKDNKELAELAAPQV